MDKKKEPSQNYPLSNLVNSNYLERRSLQLKRRTEELQFRRERLEGELNAIHIALLDLEQQFF